MPPTIFKQLYVTCLENNCTQIVYVTEFYVPSFCVLKLCIGTFKYIEMVNCKRTNIKKTEF